MNSTALHMPNPFEFLHLDARLMENDHIRLLPASEYRALDRNLFLSWCLVRARYGIPTVELVDWLKTYIGGRSAIEIGAGNGDLGHHLKIVRTDNYCQTGEGAWYFEATGFPPTRPTKDVFKMDAVQAIRHYGPKVVIASWLTQKCYPHEAIGDGNMYGPEEEEILELADIYIHIGNANTHGTKRIMKHPHQELRFPWLISRASDPSQNNIYIWTK